MKYYFQLQYTRLARWLKHIGIHPIVGLVVSLMLFVVVSLVLFHKTEFAGWIYLAGAMSVLLKLSQSQRNDFLKNLFSTFDYRVIRLVENVAASLPFIIFLVYIGDIELAVILFFLSLLFSLFRVRRLFNGTIPTPFKAFPFEFIVGFRKTFWMIGIAYFLILKGLQVDNYYLGLFGLVLLFLTSLSYYQNPEETFFVWIHSLSPEKFLLRKYSTAICCTSILSLIGLAAILVGFSSDWVTTMIVYLLANVVLGAMILTKYSRYPQDIGIPQGILFTLSVLFPPILLFTMWFFYSQSIKRLNTYLEC